MVEKIEIDLKEAMKSQDKFSLSVIRMLKSALQLEKISKNHDLSDEEALTVVKRQVKQRKDSIVEYQKYNKLDEVENLEKEISLLSKYLPAEASEEQIIETVENAFTELNPTSMKDMGKIMNFVSSKLSNADMSLVSKLVKERLLK